MALPPPTSLETVVLTSGSLPDATVAYVAPGRGGMVTRLFVGDRSVLYLDESTLLDPSKNVRGGNPVLFPSPGKLTADRFERDGRSGSLGQHGFARNAAWEEVERAGDSITLRLASSEATRAVYPWDFTCTFRVLVRDRLLRIEQRIEAGANDSPLPFGAGFHPYFQVPQAWKGAVRIPTTATRAWDNRSKKELVLDAPLAIDLTAAEVDLHLHAHEDPVSAGQPGAATTARLDLGGGQAVVLRASDEYRTWVVWTLEGRDFVCLEPWTCAADALNTGEALLFVEPGGRRDLFVEMAV